MIRKPDKFISRKEKKFGYIILEEGNIELRSCRIIEKAHIT